MPAPRASPQQQLRAYELYRQGSGPTAIREKLVEEFGEVEENKAVSARTVATWVKTFKGLVKETISLDAQFEWHRLEEYGLPWEASTFILEMWAFVMEGEVFPVFKILIPPVVRPVPVPPTLRQVRWWWRVHLAAPELQMFDVWYLAESCVSCELARDLLGVPLEMAGLQAFLAYQPWASEGKYQAYCRAIEGKIIPQPRSLEKNYSEAVAIRDRTTNPVEIWAAHFRPAVSMIADIDITSGRESLLPSQKWELLIRQFQAEDNR